MLHTSSEAPSGHWKSMYSGSTTPSAALHASIPKSIRLTASDCPSSPSHPYYQAYAPFPGPTPYQAYAPGWAQAAPQIEITIGPSPGVYSSGGYSYGVPKPPSNGDPSYPRKRAPSDSDHSSNYSQHHAPYQHSRNPSSASIGHNSHERSSIHPELDRVKSQSRTPSSTVPPHYPKPSAHPTPSSRHDSKFQRIRLASLLSGRTTDRPGPFIDWHVWDKMHTSASRDATGQFCVTDLELDAFDPPVREPIFIKGLPGKSDGFSLAIQRWGPIRVSPRRQGSSITVSDIMSAISLWMMVPIQPEDWKIFDKIFEKHVSDAFETRKMCAKTTTTTRPLVGFVKDRAQIVDSLFCRVRWDGMVISDDFGESKAVYLRLKDSSLRI